MRPRPIEEMEEASRLYNTGLNFKEVEAITGINQSVIQKYMVRNGYPTRTTAAADKKRLSKDIEIKAIEAYKSGKSSIEVGKELGIVGKSVLNIVQRNGLETRTIQETNRVHKVREDIFDVVDTEEKAYWLGFITADGCITKTDKRSHLSIGLGLKDELHVRKLGEFLIEGEPPVSIVDSRRYNKVHKSVRLTAYSQHMVDRLIELGITPRKSLKESVCKEIPEVFMRHYWRGLIDGDGCIHKSVLNIGTSSLILYGGPEIVGAFKHLVELKVGGNRKISVCGKKGGVNSYTLGVKADIVVMLEYLYKDSTIYLDRKKEKAETIIAEFYNKQ